MQFNMNEYLMMTVSKNFLVDGSSEMQCEFDPGARLCACLPRFQWRLL